MLARIRKAMEDKDQGFTLIELLVVMIIIGILAAIAIPLYLDQRNKGYEATAKSDAQAIATDISSALTDGNPTPAAVALAADNGGSTSVTNLNVAITGTPDTLTSKVSGGDKVVGSVGIDGSWCVAVGNKNGGQAFAMSSVGGLTKNATCAGTAVKTTGGPYTYTNM